MTATYTVGELFAGVGGFGMGFEQQGFRILWQAEWDKHCQSILRRHWPDCALYGDVTDVNGAEIAPVDVITFGSPCQDLSVAGKRAGLVGDRSSMFFQAVRIIKEMRDATDGVFPRVAVWENVTGALTSNKGADFGVVLDALADVGAVAIEWAVLDARWFGVPQRRRRVFVVAVFDPSVAKRCPDPLLPVCEGRRRDSAKGKPERKDVATSLADRIGSNSGERVNITTDHETWVEGDVAPTLNAFDNATETQATVVAPTIIFDSGSHGFPHESKDVFPTLTGRMGTGGNNTPLAVQPLVYDGYNQDLDDSGVHRTLRIGRDSSDFVAQPIIFDGTRHDDFRMDTEIVPTLKQRMGTGGGQVPMVFEPGAIGRLNGERHSVEVSHTLRANMGDNLPAVVQPVTVFQPGTMVRLGGGVWDDTVPTLRAEAKRGDNEPHIFHPLDYAVRRLTPLECERLMGWPDDHTRWTDDGREQADSHRYRQCGNGVATPVAAWVAKQIHQLFECKQLVDDGESNG